MSNSVISVIIEFLIGKKYYANIINVIGTDGCQLCSFIFESPSDAEAHRREISSTRSYQWVETVSFRSRNDFRASVKKYSRNV